MPCFLATRLSTVRDTRIILAASSAGRWNLRGRGRKARVRPWGAAAGGPGGGATGLLAPLATGRAPRRCPGEVYELGCGLRAQAGW